MFLKIRKDQKDKSVKNRLAQKEIHPGKWNENIISSLREMYFCAAGAVFLLLWEWDNIWNKIKPIVSGEP